MNRNVMIIVAGGFLIAVLVAVLVQATLSGGKDDVAVVVQDVKKVKILTAKKELKAGERVTLENAVWSDWPEDAVFPGALVQEDDEKVTEAASGILISSVEKDQPILKSYITSEVSSKFLSASIGEGMRAYSIEVEPSTMVSGFVGPGDYVDVLLSYSQEIEVLGQENPTVENFINENINETATETILQNIKVLGVDQNATRSEKGMARLGRTMVLEVDLQQAEVLALASNVGELSLALRKLGDETIEMTSMRPITTDVRVTGAYREVMGRLSSMMAQTRKKSSTPSPAYNIGSGNNGNYVRVYSGSAVESMPAN